MRAENVDQPYFPIIHTFLIETLTSVVCRFQTFIQSYTFLPKVRVEDVDDNDPVFSSSVYEFHVPHDTAADTTVGQVTVTDDDIGSNADFTVSIVSGNGAGYFSMEGLRVTTAKTVRYDEVKEFILTLRAQIVAGASDNYVSF